MQNEKSTFRFSLRALFVCMASVALGVVALKGHSPWTSIALSLVVIFLISYASVAVLAGTGSRRLFWAAFATTAVMFQFGFKELPMDCAVWLWFLLFPDTDVHMKLSGPFTDFHNIATLLSQLLVSTVFGFVIPWLVQRGR